MLALLKWQYLCLSLNLRELVYLHGFRHERDSNLAVLVDGLEAVDVCN